MKPVAEELYNTMFVSCAGDGMLLFWDTQNNKDERQVRVSVYHMLIGIMTLHHVIITAVCEGVCTWLICSLRL